MRTIILFFFIVFTINCNNDNSPEESKNSPEQSKKIKFSSIGGGYLYPTNGAMKSNKVITNVSDWKKLIVYPRIKVDPLETNIDFDMYKVIAVIDKPRPHTGYYISITSVTENKNNIVVTVKASPPPGTFLTAPSQPFHIVKIPKIEKPIVFIEL